MLLLLYYEGLIPKDDYMINANDFINMINNKQNYIGKTSELATFYRKNGSSNINISYNNLSIHNKTKIDNIKIPVEIITCRNADDYLIVSCKDSMDYYNNPY